MNSLLSGLVSACASPTKWKRHTRSLGNLSGPSTARRKRLFTENDTNYPRIFGVEGPGTYVKDAFHEYIVGGKQDAVNPAREGTKACAVYQLTLAPNEERVLYLRLAPETSRDVPREQWPDIFDPSDSGSR